MEELRYDYIIIGAGVAGLASAQYAARGGLNTIVLEGTSMGGQATQIAELENYPGVFPAVNGYDFIDTMRKQAESFGAQIKQVTVSSIDKKGSDFCAPCGMCRQAIREFCDPDFPVILVEADENGVVQAYKVYRLEELLVDSFGPDNLT